MHIVYRSSVLLAADSVDSLVTAGVVVEGSGGASIQSLVSSIIANGTSSNNFGAATINFAPTDSTQGACWPHCWDFHVLDNLFT